MKGQESQKKTLGHGDPVSRISALPSEGRGAMLTALLFEWVGSEADEG